ncbi:MAG: hypothetical protein JNL05_00425 [Flavobacteriales bacterium]|nr:hypothetical protein [Flavobacteriales bacterium]
MSNRRENKDPGKVNKTFRLDSHTVKAIERLAEADNRTVNNMVETILKNTVKEREAIKC